MLYPNRNTFNYMELIQKIRGNREMIIDCTEKGGRKKSLYYRQRKKAVIYNKITDKKGGRKYPEVHIYDY